MKRLALLSILLALSGLCAGQTAGIVDPSRVINWNSVGAKTIPTSRPQCGSTIAAGASAATINAAIAACPAGDAVQLGAGVFNISTGLTFNSGTTHFDNVTLRGMGADQTIIIATGTASCDNQTAIVCVHNGDGDYVGGPGTTASWTGDYTAGLTVITLSAHANLFVGSEIFLDQFNDTYAISNITCTGGIATASIGTNTFSTSNGKPVVTIQGVIPTGYNTQPNGQTGGSLTSPGNWPVTGSTSSTISFNLGTCPGAYVSGGSLTADDGALTITNDSSFSSAEPVQGNNPGRPGNSGSDPAVTNATWSSAGGGTATITTSGLAFLDFGTLINVNNVTPSGYQVVEHGITGSTTTTLSYQVTSNPGTFTGAGDVNAFACVAPGGGFQCRSATQGNIVAACGTSTFGAACTSNTITLQDPIDDPHIRADRSPGAWWGNGVLPATGIGVESMTLDSTNVNAAGIVTFYNAVNSWTKGLRTLNAGSSHVLRFQASHITNRDSYMYGNQGHGGTSSQSYCIDDYTGSSSNLTENNIFQHCAVPMQHESGMGNVDGYNFSIDNDNGASPGFPLSGPVEHGPGTEFDLYEGDFVTTGLREDAFHGNHHAPTIFRTRMQGLEPGRNTQTFAIMIQTGTREANIIGNVLGTSGFHTSYTWVFGTNSGSDDADCSASVIATGWSGLCDSRIATNNYNAPAVEMDDPQANPPNATQPGTTMLWGNYDTVNAAVRFVNAEVPSTLPVYANAVPASHTLPASFYGANYSAFWKTAWGTPPYPPIGPDVSGGNVASVGGFANYIPAAVAFQNLTIDATYSTTSSITAGSCTGNVATVTIGSQAANVDPGSVLVITGVTPSSYNTPALATGTPRTQVSATAATTVSYAVSSCASYVSGGSAVTNFVGTFNAATAYSQLPATTSGPALNGTFTLNTGTLN